jgi:hypothetical protein
VPVEVLEELAVAVEENEAPAPQEAEGVKVGESDGGCERVPLGEGDRVPVPVPVPEGVPVPVPVPEGVPVLVPVGARAVAKGDFEGDAPLDNVEVGVGVTVADATVATLRTPWFA